MFSNFWKRQEVRLPHSLWLVLVKEKENMISKRVFEAKFEQLFQTREEVLLKIYDLSTLGSIEHQYGDGSSY